MSRDSTRGDTNTNVDRDGRDAATGVYRRRGSGEFLCGACGKRFLHRSGFYRHRRTQHDTGVGASTTTTPYSRVAVATRAERSNYDATSRPTRLRGEARSDATPTYPLETVDPPPLPTDQPTPPPPLPEEPPPTPTQEPSEERTTEGLPERLPAPNLVWGIDPRNPPSFQEDVAQPVVDEDDNALNNVLRSHWSAIVTRWKRRWVVDIINVRLLNEERPNEEVRRRLLIAWHRLNCRIKVNGSVGAVLRHKITGEYRYFHSSSNNATIFPNPALIESERDMLVFCDAYVDADVETRALRGRPDTSWQLKFVTNATFYVYKLLGMGKVGGKARGGDGGGGIVVTGEISDEDEKEDKTKEEDDNGGIDKNDAQDAIEMRKKRSYVNPTDGFVRKAKRERRIRDVSKDSRGRPFDDNLCFFRCLALHWDCVCPAKAARGCTCRHASSATVRELFREFCAYHSLPFDRKQMLAFQGVSLDDLVAAEKIFCKRFIIMELDENDVANVVWTSRAREGERVHLHHRDGHFDYVSHISLLAKCYKCPTCGALYSQHRFLSRHICRSENATKFVYPGGAFKPPDDIFKKMETLVGISVPAHLQLFPYRATFDIECLLRKDNLPSGTGTTTFTSRHELLSISVCSNVPGFTDPVCFVRRDEDYGGVKNEDGDGCEKVTTPQGVQACVDEFVGRLREISQACTRLLSKVFEPYTIALNESVKRVLDAEDEFDDLVLSSPGLAKAKRWQIKNLPRAFRRYVSTIPVVGFNSQKYDLNVIKAPLIRSIRNAAFNTRAHHPAAHNDNIYEDDDDDESIDEREEELFTETEGSDCDDDETLTNGNDYESDDSDEDDEGVRFVVLKQSNVTCLETNFCRFLDICNFLPPGVSYEKYIKTFGCSAEKGFFPYEWVDSLEKLKHPSLPPRECFYSQLKNSSISEDDYKTCVEVWHKNDMKSFKDFLVWYNNLDVIPFLEAIEKQSAIYAVKGIDMLKSAISLPGLAVKWLFKVCPLEDDDDENGDDDDAPNRVKKVLNRQKILLIDKYNSDLYSLIRNNIVGGPSIIFHRYHERNVTRIRDIIYGTEAKPCALVLGIDANALYLYALMQPMPTGKPIRRRYVNDFKAERTPHLIKVAYEWLEWRAWRDKARICHGVNDKESRIGVKNLPVDGFCKESNTVYQFHGCYWHGHPCKVNDGIFFNPTRRKPMCELYDDTLKKETYIKALGYTLIVGWECEWETNKKQDPVAAEFARSLKSSFFPKPLLSSELEVIESIRNGSFFGFVECDISVPEGLVDKFSEMSPIFKNVSVGRAHLSDHMLSRAESSDYLKRPQRMLIGSLYGVRILLLSELARWYLQHGLVITRVYQTIGYAPRAVYYHFGESVSDARRAGDANPDLALLANTSKLIGNSVYGKTITDKEKHRDTVYRDGAQAASRSVADLFFSELDEIDDDLYEVTMFKKKMKMDIPVTVGFTVLQYAKLRMLQFYYDFMDRFVDRRDFEYVEMDTDSAYMALSGSLESVVRPQLRKEFYDEYHSWFPRPFCNAHRNDYIDLKTTNVDASWQSHPCCQKVYKHDMRTPGLFKEEFKGTGIIALNSKTYYCWNDDDDDVKYSSKGLSKRTNKLTKDAFLSVLTSGVSKAGINTGFVRKSNTTFTYSQNKNGLTYFYAKRKVHKDGVTTSHIDL